MTYVCDPLGQKGWCTWQMPALFIIERSVAEHVHWNFSCRKCQRNKTKLNLLMQFYFGNTFDLFIIIRLYWSFNWSQMSHAHRNPFPMYVEQGSSEPRKFQCNCKFSRPNPVFHFPTHNFMKQQNTSQSRDFDHSTHVSCDTFLSFSLLYCLNVAVHAINTAAIVNGRMPWNSPSRSSGYIRRHSCRLAIRIPGCANTFDLRHRRSESHHQLPQVYCPSSCDRCYRRPAQLSAGAQPFATCGRSSLGRFFRLLDGDHRHFTFPCLPSRQGREAWHMCAIPLVKKADVRDRCLLCLSLKDQLQNMCIETSAVASVREITTFHCRGGVRINFDTTLHKDDMHKSKRELEQISFRGMGNSCILCGAFMCSRKVRPRSQKRIFNGEITNWKK